MNYKIGSFYKVEEDLFIYQFKSYEYKKFNTNELKSLINKIEKRISDKTLLSTKKNIDLQRTVNYNVIAPIPQSTIKIENIISSIEKEINNLKFLTHLLTTRLILISQPVVLVNEKTKEELTFDSIVDEKLDTILKNPIIHFKDEGLYKEYLNTKIY
jgi:hypothetical protein